MLFSIANIFRIGPPESLDRWIREEGFEVPLIWFIAENIVHDFDEGCAAMKPHLLQLFSFLSHGITFAILCSAWIQVEFGVEDQAEEGHLVLIIEGFIELIP